MLPARCVRPLITCSLVRLTVLRHLHVTGVAPVAVLAVEIHSCFLSCSQALLAQPVDTANAAGPIRARVSCEGLNSEPKMIGIVKGSSTMLTNIMPKPNSQECR